MKFSLGKKGKSSSPPPPNAPVLGEGEVVPPKPKNPKLESAIPAPHPKGQQDVGTSSSKPSLKLGAGRSIDSIISKTKNSSEKFTHRVSSDLIDREKAVAALETELEQRDREIKLKESALQEQERELSEFELLLQVRERNLNKLETSAQANKAIASGSSIDSSGQLKELQDAVKDLENKYNDAMDLLEDKELEAKKYKEEAEAHQNKIKDLEEQLENSAAPEATLGEDDLAAREKALMERETLLDEREAFIEESENTLFNKAQELQELQTHLEQIEDDGQPQ